MVVIIRVNEVRFSREIESVIVVFVDALQTENNSLDGVGSVFRIKFKIGMYDQAYTFM